jgi:hypothetical protein
MNIINLTPHEVILCGQQIKPDGTLARVSMTRKQVGQLDVDGTSVPIYRTVLGTVTGLPPANDGVGYIVSAMVRSAAPERRDLYSPADLQRDASGNVIGCESLDQNP